jgi:signal transduction histidine kinase
MPHFLKAPPIDAERHVRNILVHERINGGTMLSLPGIKGLIKTRDQKQHAHIDLANLLEIEVLEPESREALLIHLAGKLDLEVVALIEIEREGKAAKMMAVGRCGNVSELTLPALDMGGHIPDLILNAKPASGRAKLFARGEVFPTDGSWCDLIPMDSLVTYAFFPLSDRGKGDAGARFLLIAEHWTEEEDPAFIPRALACAGLMSCLSAASDLRAQTSLARSLTLHLEREGYSIENGSETAPVIRRRSAPVSACESHGEKLRLLSRFMSSVAHEIKNPLTGISAGVQYLAKKLQPGLAEDETVEFILTEINRLNRIVDDLYKIARPPELMIMPINLNEIVGKSLLCLSELIMKKRLTVTQDLKEGIPEFDADPDRVQQILINIIKNAVEATPEQGSLSLESWKDDSRAFVRITDSGPGIPDKAMEHLFEPFYSTKERGTGLGLCISQRIIDEHGGKIRVEKPEDGGTSFVIELPLGGKNGEDTCN